jgi:hypothetical protein
MIKNSTLIIITDNRNKNKTEVIDVNQFLDETDSYLNRLFKGYEIGAPDAIVHAALMKTGIKK